MLATDYRSRHSGGMSMVRDLGEGLTRKGEASGTSWPYPPGDLIVLDSEDSP